MPQVNAGIKREKEEKKERARLAAQKVLEAGNSESLAQARDFEIDNIFIAAEVANTRDTDTEWSENTEMRFMKPPHPTVEDETESDVAASIMTPSADDSDDSDEDLYMKLPKRSSKDRQPVTNWSMV
jgi:hypothetical protein